MHFKVVLIIVGEIDEEEHFLLRCAGIDICKLTLCARMNFHSSAWVEVIVIVMEVCLCVY